MPYELKREDILGLARRLNAETHEKGEELFFKYCLSAAGTVMTATPSAST